MLKISHQNFGTVNKNAVTVEDDRGSTTVYFSYDTPVAFTTDGEDIVCSENIWSRTTGKFLNELQPDKNKRIPNAKFLELLSNL